MKFSLALTLILFSSVIQAKIVARVLDIKGNAFSFVDKKATELKYGSKLVDLSEIMVEDGSTLSLVNQKGHIFHINGGSLVKLFDGIMELKNGHVWIQSNNSQKGLFNTPNSVGEFSEGELIYSFDNISGKTQLLVLTGDVKFSNAIEPSLYTKISSGFFSLIDPKYENGLPRGATKVGLKSYKNMKNIFADFDKLQETKFEETLWGEKPSSARSIASVVPKATHQKSRGKLIRITTYETSSRLPASVNGSPLDYYKNLVKKDAWKYKPIKNNNTAPIRYFGTQTSLHIEVKINKKTAKTYSNSIKKSVRAPASIQKVNLINDLKKSSFETSLDSESTKIKRHSNEVNHLIDELKSYKQNFKKDY
jgi:hypothetical protein